MSEHNKTPHAKNGDDDAAQGMSPQLREMIEQVAEETIRTKQGLMVEEHARRAVDQLIERQLERVIVREGLVERQLDALKGPRDRMLQEQRAQLEQHAGSLLGPQDLLETADAIKIPDPPTSRNARPLFKQDPAKWNLPRIPPPELDQPAQQD